MTAKVGFVLLSNSGNPAPSTRVAVLNVLPSLQQMGWPCEVVFDPPHAVDTPEISISADELARRGFKIICIQKIRGPSILRFIEDLRKVGICSVYLLCDHIQPDMVQACDATAVVTDYLRSLYPPELQSKMHVVHDGIERPEVMRNPSAKDRQCSGLRAVMVSSFELIDLPVLHTPPPWLTVSIVGAYPTGNWLYRMRRARWAIAQKPQWRDRIRASQFYCHPRIQRIPWTPEGVYEEIRRADIGIIPIDTTVPLENGYPASWKRKSENRLTLLMSAGLPVVATPIPAYSAVINHGVNGFLASDKTDWNVMLESLRSPQLRARIGTAARESVADRFSIEQQARLLCDVFQRVVLVRKSVY